MKITAAIIAGGRAERLGGACKPLLVVGGVRLLDRQLAALSGIADEVLLVVGEDDSRFSGLPLRLVRDRHPGLGPLAGLEAALAEAANDRVLLVGGDMPTLSPAALRLVADCAPEAAACAPFVDGRFEPLHARYHRRLAPLVAEHLRSGDRSLQRLLAAARAHALDEAALRAVDPSLASLASVNTPDDLARFDRLLKPC